MPNRVEHIRHFDFAQCGSGSLSAHHPERKAREKCGEPVEPLRSVFVLSGVEGRRTGDARSRHLALLGSGLRLPQYFLQKMSEPELSRRNCKEYFQSLESSNLNLEARNWMMPEAGFNPASNLRLLVLC
jgi:hypothetical protein